LILKGDSVTYLIRYYGTNIIKPIRISKKDLILIYLRNQPGVRIKINDIRNVLLPNVKLSRMQQYFEELGKENYIWVSFWGKILSHAIIRNLLR